MNYPLSLLLFEKMPIIEQLKIEEALLRLDCNNWCLINQGSPPAIVMGISEKSEEMVDWERQKKGAIPLIRRFSGGGTVVVDENTLFISFLFQSDSHSFAPFPEEILHWTGEFYKEAFSIDNFHIQENDYAIDDKKCGGNAQYLRKGRWLHHTTFLFDFDREKMEYLLLPKRQPSYRKQRAHRDFLCPLKNFFDSKEEIVEKITKTLKKRFSLSYPKMDTIIPLLKEKHRQSTHLVPFGETK